MKIDNRVVVTGVGVLTPIGIGKTPFWRGLLERRFAQLSILAEIAARHLFLETLETRNSDSLDFHDLAVWSIREALLAAYHAGRESGPLPRTAPCPRCGSVIYLVPCVACSMAKIRGRNRSGSYTA